MWTQDLAEAIELEEKAADELRQLRKEYGRAGIAPEDVSDGNDWESEHTGLRTHCKLGVCVDYPYSPLGDFLQVLDRLNIRYETRSYPKRYRNGVVMTEIHVGHTSFIFNPEGELEKVV